MMIYFGKRPLGRNIRYHRQKQYMSCAKLARLCGIPYRMLHLIERGFLHDIDYDHLEALARTLGTTQKKLMG